MPTINAQNSSTDLTVQIFDKFYSYKQFVPAQEYDAVNSYLQSVFATNARRPDQGIHSVLRHDSSRLRGPLA